MITKHLLYGVPGTGKSTLAKQLASKYLYLYIELDEIRPKVEKLVSRAKEPFIYEGTTSAWEKFGELSQDNAIKGLIAVRKAFENYVAQELNQHGIGYVAEAAFLSPNNLIKEKGSKVTLVVTRDEKLHHSHFFSHRRRGEEMDNQFKAARYIQNYLISEADKLGVGVLENNNIDLTMSKEEGIL